MPEKETPDSRPESPPEADRPRRRAAAPPDPLTRLLVMDKDILHLVARRTRLLNAAYAGPHAGGEADAEHSRPVKRKPSSDSRPSERTRVEKTLRAAWQAEAARISPDQRLARELFALLQNISIPGHAGGERPKASGFRLSPPRRPVHVNLPGPASRFETAAWLALASAVGAELRLANVPLGDRTIDALKALNQAGGKLAWEADHVLRAHSGGALDFSDAVIFVGNEPLAVWLAAFLAAPRLGRIKFMGGPDLRNLDITPLRQFAPQFGARLAPVVPGGKGLPARLECSGLLPEVISVPSALPADALTALLVLVATWNTAIAVDCSDHPEAAVCRARACPLLMECGAQFSETDGVTHYRPATLKIPPSPRLPLDPLLTASFLALPAFAGGESRLSGHWDAALPGNRAWMDLLRGAGLEISRTDTGLAAKRTRANPAGRTQSNAEPPVEALPLSLALVANNAVLNGSCSVDLPILSAQDALIAEEFLGLLGCALEAPAKPGDPILLRHARPDSRNPDAEPWAAPSAAWAIGFALGAFIRPGLSLSNPGCLTDILPAFWTLYNSLPEPRMPAPAFTPPEPQTTARTTTPPRRRLIASSPE